MAYKSQIIPDKFSNEFPGKLLEIYDNPKNFDINDCRDEVSELKPNSFPKHGTVLITHGAFALNHKDRVAVVDEIEKNKQKVWGLVEDREITRRQAYRLLRNFSDWWTRKIAKKMFTLTDYTWWKFFYPDNVIIAKSPRIKWDANRSKEPIDGFKKTTDFNKNKLIPRENQTEDDTWDKDHEIYHGKIESRLSWLEKNDGWSITFDIHDTGVRKEYITEELDHFRPWGYPMMEIGTLDWESCNPEILEYFAEQVKIYFGFTPVINEQDKWGYVTQHNGRDARKKMKSEGKNPKRRNMMQIELGRYLYMKESTQEIDKEQMEKVSAALRMCIQKTCEKFWDEYFASLD